MIIVQGGVGPVVADRQDRVRTGLRNAVTAGQTLLDRGATALDAVVAAIRVLEDDPEFGAGLGSALTRDGTIETCASVMDGSRRRAGAVAAVPDLAQPVIDARAVLEIGEHVILAGQAAARYAAEIGIPAPQPGALVTPRAMQQFREAQAQNARQHPDGGGVGAIARDQKGGFAAATSSGGSVYRRPGSIDDSSIPGAGSWADDKVAVATSGGEAILRVQLAHEIAMRVTDGAGIRAAVKASLADLHKLDPETLAGAIVVDKDAWVALQIGPAMPVAWIDQFGFKDAIGFPL